MNETYKRTRKTTYVVDKQGQHQNPQAAPRQADRQHNLGNQGNKQYRHHTNGGTAHRYFSDPTDQKRHPETSLKENRNNVIFKNIKRQLRLSNKELSDRIGVSKSVIDSWSRGLDSTKAVTGMYREEGVERRTARHKHMNDEFFYRFIVTLTEADLDNLRFNRSAESSLAVAEKSKT